MTQMNEALDPPKRKVKPRGSKRMRDLESALYAAEQLLANMYIPGPRNEVYIDGLRVHFHDRAAEKANVLRQCRDLLPNRERID